MASGLAWGVKGQTVPDDYVHGGVIQAGGSYGDWVAGCDVWYDGKIWAAVGHQTLGGFETEIRVSTDAGSTVGSITLKAQYAPFDSVWPNDQACGEPTYEYAFVSPPNRAADASLAYTVGGAKMTFSDGMESSEGDDAAIPSPQTHAWLFTKRLRHDTGAWEDPRPGLGFPHAIRTFVVTSGTSTDFVENFAVDALPSLALVTTDEEGPFPPSIAVGGAFRGTVAFQDDPVTTGHDPNDPVVTRTSNGASQDGFFTVMSPHANFIFQGAHQEAALHAIASSGADAVLGVSYDQAGGRLLVCGYYAGQDADFDPGSGVVNPTNYAGGKDLFVACYTSSGSAAQNTFNLVLEWVYTWGTENDDAAESVAADVTGNVFFTGWTGDTVGVSARGDVVIGRIGPDGPDVPTGTWQRAFGSTGDDRGMDVCVDGLGRPVVTGYFEGTVDFNGGGTLGLSSLGLTDVFVARYLPTSSAFQWAFRVGDTSRDEGLAVAVDQYNSARLVHGGSFIGEPDFDPGSGTNSVVSTGEDGFVSYFEHAPGESDLHITLLLEGTGLAPGFGSLFPFDPADGDFRRLGIANAIDDTMIVPAGGAHKAVSVQAILYGTSHYGHDGNEPLLRLGVVQVLPPTVVTNLTRPLAAARMNAFAHYHSSQTEFYNNAGEAIGFAADYMGDARYNDLGGITRHALLSAELAHDDNNGTALAAARSAAVSGQDPAFHLLHGLALNTGLIGSIDRSYMRDSVTEAMADLYFPEGWSTFGGPTMEGERNCGLAAEVPGYGDGTGNINPAYETTINNMISQMAHLLGDYDRNGAIEFTFGGSCFGCLTPSFDPCGADWDAFKADSASSYSGSNVVERANWNFDFDNNPEPPNEQYDGHVGPQGTPIGSAGYDFSKFFTGALFSNGTPCP